MSTVPSTSPSLFFMPFADMKRALESLSYNTLRMGEQKDLDPNDTVELLMPALEVRLVVIGVGGDPLFG